MCWRLILKEFGPNIKLISGVDNIVADTISKFMSTSIDQDEIFTTGDISWKKKLFATRMQKFEIGYP